MKEEPDWRSLELLVAKIQAQLAPDATVEHNVRIIGRRTGASRQIDVLVRQKIGQYEMLIGIDCKDYAVPVDVTGVEGSQGLFEDAGCHKGVIVSPRGFTSTAKTRAKGFGIDLYSPVDTDPHKWQAHVQVPAICDFRGALVSFGISVSAPKPMRMFENFFHSDALDESGVSLGTPYDMAVEKWNSGLYPVEPGEHRDLLIFESARVFVDNGYNDTIPAKLTVSLFVQRELFFGHLPISQISGFKDELSGGIITNAFTTGIFDPQQVVETWQRLESIDAAPSPPLFALRGLYAWER